MPDLQAASELRLTYVYLSRHCHIASSHQVVEITGHQHPCSSSPMPTYMHGVTGVFLCATRHRLCSPPRRLSLHEARQHGSHPQASAIRP